MLLKPRCDGEENMISLRPACAGLTAFYATGSDQRASVTAFISALVKAFQNFAEFQQKFGDVLV